MGAAAADDLGDLLADGPQAQGVLRHLGCRPQQPEDVALGRVGFDAEEEVRAGQGEEVDPVRVEDGAEVEGLPEQGGCPGRWSLEDLVD
jgi:hypothetical protein